MLISILFILFVILLIVSYFVFNKEIAQPAIIFCAAYTMSLFCAVLNINKWGINLSEATFWILLLGGIEFVVVSYLVHIFLKKKNNGAEKKQKETEEKNVKEIKISNIFLILIAIYNIAIIIILLLNVLDIAGKFGEYNNFSQALTLYKQNTAYSKKTELPDYLTILMKPIISTAYIAIFIFFNNIIKSKEKMHKKLLKNSKYLIFPILYFIQRFIESNRGSILNFCIGAIVMAIIIWSIKNEWRKHIKVKIIFVIVAISCVGMILFYYSASLIGRINNKGMIDYITYYIGGSIECFNQWVKSSTKAQLPIGEYTFARTIMDLNKLGIIDRKLDIKDYSKFVYYNGEMVGNIYTSYRSWMHDWGIIGAIVLQAVLAIIVNCIYNKIKCSKTNIYFKNYLIILYGYIIYVIFLHPIDSYFYLETFTIATLGVFIVMTILYYIAITVRVNFKGGFKLIYKDKQLIKLGEKND